MAVMRNGTLFGCRDQIETQSAALQDAGRKLSSILRSGGSLPSKWTASGIVYDVARIGSTPDGTKNNQTDIASSVKANRGGRPTIVVLAPNERPYRYNNFIDLSPDTYVVGYGATVMPLVAENVRWNLADRSGLFGFNMFGTDESKSRWPERFQKNGYTSLGTKNGSYAKGLDDSNSAAFVQFYNISDAIVADVHSTGTVQGFIRHIGSTETLIQSCSAFRTHSDSIHITKESGHFTVRDCHIFDGGDDCISIVQYDSAREQPHNGLLENCRAFGGRTRGFTAISARDILYRKCVAAYTTMAGFRFGPTSAHSVHDTQNIICEDCEAWRCSRLASNSVDSASGAALIATSSHACTGVEFVNCRGFSYGPDKYCGDGFVRRHDGGAGISYVADKNTIEVVLVESH